MGFEISIDNGYNKTDDQTGQNVILFDFVYFQYATMLLMIFY